jgi:plastocyanin
MRKLRAAAGALIFCATAGQASAETADAQIKLFQFQPKTLEIAAGTTVRWVNGDDIEHSVTAGAPGQETGAFDSGFFKKNAGFEHNFAEPGSFSYFCKRHPSMKAVVTVTP